MGIYLFTKLSFLTNISRVRVYTKIMRIMHKTFMGCANTGPVASLGRTELRITQMKKKIPEENIKDKSYQIVQKAL